MCLLQQIIPTYFLAGCNIFGHNGIVGMVVDSAVPRVVHSCASLGTPRRCSLCLEGLYRKRRSTPLVRLCSARLPAIVHSSALILFPTSSESGDQSEYGYDDRPAALPAASCLGLALSASASGAHSRRSLVRVVSTLASAYDSRSRICSRCVLAVCLMVSGHLSTQTCSK